MVAVSLVLGSVAAYTLYASREVFPRGCAYQVHFLPYREVGETRFMIDAVSGGPYALRDLSFSYLMASGSLNGTFLSSEPDSMTSFTKVGTNALTLETGDYAVVKAAQSGSLKVYHRGTWVGGSGGCV
jgi:hypothetical protein